VCVNVTQLSGRSQNLYVVQLFMSLDTGFSLWVPGFSLRAILWICNEQRGSW
jgi:hypothetical protein